MLSVGQGLAPPTLRLYSWSEPVVILGVGQQASDLNLDVCRERGYRALRRIGGGTAVYHDQEEVSIDLIVQSGTPLGPTDVHAGYRQFSQVLARALASLEIETDVVTVDQARSIEQDPQLRPICFASISPYEFFNQGRKLDGICQIRRRESIAYQAAIYHRFPVEPMIASIIHDDETQQQLRTERLAEFATDMYTARGTLVSYRDLQNAIEAAARQQLDVSIFPGQLTEFEVNETGRFIREKYGCDDWTYRR
jgi:lipoyl(octanoyl) transferase